MRIAFDHQIFAAQEYCGISRYCARLVEELDATGHDVRVVAPLHVNRYLDGVPRGLLRGRRLQPSRLGSKLVRAVGDMAARPLLAAVRPDIVHETYYARSRSAPRGARTVLTVYDMIHEKFPASFPSGDRTAALKAAAVARADHVLCISESTRADLIALQPAAAAKSSVTLLGFDPPAPASAVVSPARPHLLFVGQRGTYKNFAALLDGFAASPALRGNFDLLAVGGGKFTAGETAVIAAHGLAGQVQQRAAGEAALQRHYAGAALFVYPSLYEGFGIPPLEAMAAGTPVVAVGGGSVPEVCGDAAEYAERGDAAGLAAAIERVVGSPSRISELVAAGHRRLTRFSWAGCAAQTAAAYRSLL